MTSLTLQSTKPLKSGKSIPVLGFGVFESPPEITQRSVTAALEAGYRHFDTAQYYENEAETGSAINAFLESAGGGASKTTRSDIFFTTKILNPVEPESGSSSPSKDSEQKDGSKDEGKDEASVSATAESCRASVRRSGLDHADLFLIHTPSSGPAGRKTMWRALQRVQAEGVVHAIGVSNFGVRHLEELKSVGGPQPEVNQIELHPFLQQRDIVTYCRREGIVVQAYCPLTRGERFKDPVLVRVADAHGKSVAQVLVRWSLQRGFVPLPKSDTPARIRQNADVFDFLLSEAEMREIDDLNEDKSIFHNPVDAP